MTIQNDQFEPTPSKPDWIAVTELADELQAHEQTLFKIIARLKILTGKRRDSDRGGQTISTVSPIDADKIRVEFLKSRNTASRGNDSDDLLAEDGVFYLIQTEPLLEPGRIKVGFTTDIDGRLQKFRCVAPNVSCLKTWPCRRTWERAAIDCITAGLEQMHTEVFRTNTKSIEQIMVHADQFFALMLEP